MRLEGHGQDGAEFAAEAAVHDGAAKLQVVKDVKPAHDGDPVYQIQQQRHRAKVVRNQDRVVEYQQHKNKSYRRKITIYQRLFLYLLDLIRVDRRHVYPLQHPSDDHKVDVQNGRQQNVLDHTT